MSQQSLFDAYGFSRAEKEAALRALAVLARGMDRADPIDSGLYGQVWHVLRRIGIPPERHPITPEGAIDLLREVQEHWEGDGRWPSPDRLPSAVP